MKYNDEAFNISAQFYANTSDVEIDNIDKKWQNKLLAILLKRFTNELKQKENQNNGIVKIKFKDRFQQDADDGYHLIKELIDTQKFDSFASQYCFYLGNTDDRYDEYHSAYYEVIWDYKTYFESVSMAHIESKIESNPNENIFVEAMIDFKQLPLNYQIEILKSFSRKVDECKASYLHDQAVIECLNEGHQFSKWKKITWTTQEQVFDAGPRGYVDVDHINWERMCTRCGFKETVEHEPQELIDARKEKSKQAKIKRLERELNRLKNE